MACSACVAALQPVISMLRGMGRGHYPRGNNEDNDLVWAITLPAIFSIFYKESSMSQVMSRMPRFVGLVLASLALMLGVQSAQAATKAEIDAGVKDAMARFAKEVKGSKAFMDGAKGLLVFPKIYKGGFVVGVEGGEGALVAGGKTLDYYASGGVSWGLQAGAQAKTVIIAFMTDEALEKFRKSSGWKAGVDGSVAMVDVGAGAMLDTKTIKDPIVGFVFGQKGLMANITLEGSKYEKIHPK